MAIRVLLAEPEELLLEIYAHFLTHEGLEVATAANKEEFVEKLHGWQPDVVVLEPELSNDMGEKIFTEVSQQGSAAVIILTRSDHLATAPGVWESRVKPFPLSALANSIRAVAKRTRKYHEAIT